ncbi:MAG TPA: hypothetical protein VE666_14850 [Mycobacterium sp.]|jgi:hypothetical protein|nr:hypothetical protein [Mycobacterium sp.]
MPTKLIPWLICAGAAASIAVAPIATADPAFPTAGSESASATVMDLQAQGFDVVINWLQGRPNVPLSECRVNGINNPTRMAADPSVLSTVYVDVACPNAK